MLIVVYYAPNTSQCYICLPFPEIESRQVRLQDLLSAASYSQAGNELLGRGLYLEMEPWSYHIFNLEVL
jgi:hypothetical protein